MIIKICICILIIIIFAIFLFYYFKSKKNIAVISTLPWHIECLGFLLEYIDNYNIHVYIDKDRVNYLDYFKTKFNFNIYHINNFDEKKYDKIIKLTSSDSYNINKKHYSIYHISGEEYPDKKENTMFITLSPYVKSSYLEYKYIKSIYKDYIETNNYSKNIGFIGKFIQQFVGNQKDIIDLIDNINGNLHCFGYINHTFNNTRIINYDDIDTIDMVNKLKHCSYIIIKEHNDRYSGGITVALSLNIPLIMKKSIADVYNIPAITYNNNITELTYYINNMTYENYKEIKSNLRSYSDKEIKKNKIILNKLID